MGKFSRDKGRRGELRACKFFDSIGWITKRVSGDEAGAYGSSVAYDVEIQSKEGEASWSLQAKEVAETVPSIRTIMANGVSIGWVHFTAGPLRGRSFVIVDANDLTLFAEEVVRARQSV